jgi:signal transduction histidine kinase
VSLDTYILTAGEQQREILRNRSLKIIMVRWFYVGLLGAAGIGNILLTGVGRSHLSGYLTVLLAIFGLNIVFWFFTRQQKTNILYYKVFAQLQLLLDIGLATSSIYLQGGPLGQTVILYTVPIILASVVLLNPFGYITAILCGLAYISGSFGYLMNHPAQIEDSQVLAVFLFYPLFFVLLSIIIVRLSRYTNSTVRRESYDELLSMLTHQLRHPISAMAAILDVLKHGEDFPKLPEKSREYIALIEKENSRLYSLVTNLLEAGRIEPQQTSQAKFKPVDIIALLKETAESCAMSVQRSKDLVLRMSNDLVLINGDLPQLRMAFDNLIDNAFLYSYAGSRVTIELQTHNSTVHIKIIDEGKGVSKEQQRKLHEIFNQMPYDNFEAGIPPKAGLGLYVSKRIIERHLGTFTFSSEGHEGTTIGITLKRSEDEQTTTN